MTEHARLFEQHRRLLFSVAYRMLGTLTDAEDAVQEAWLRWERVSLDNVATPQAYLVTVVTRLCIDQLRSARMKREVYVGPWLPEPIVDTALGADEHAALADSLSMALLLMLERLNPVERAAFLLRDVFDYSYPELAAILEKSEDNCRQLVKRAKDRVKAGETKYVPSLEEQDRLVAAFLGAIEQGDVDALAAHLQEDATLYADGGGKVRSAMRPVHGALNIAKFLIGVTNKFRTSSHRNVLARVNGVLGVVVYDGDTADGVITADVEGGKVREIYIVRNPEKLVHVPEL